VRFTLYGDVTSHKKKIMMPTQNETLNGDGIYLFFLCIDGIREINIDILFVACILRLSKYICLLHEKYIMKTNFNALNIN